MFQKFIWNIFNRNFKLLSINFSDKMKRKLPIDPSSIIIIRSWIWQFTKLRFSSNNFANLAS